MPQHVASELKVCSNCARIRPLSCFRRRRRDSAVRVNTCNDCRNAQERRRRREARERRLGQSFQKLSTAYCRARCEAQRALILEETVHAVGGFQAFLEEWLNMISEMRSRKQYSPRLCRFYELIFEFMRERDERSKRDLQSISDEDLEAVLREQLRKMIQQDPQIAVEAAQEIGWTVAPA